LEVAQLIQRLRLGLEVLGGGELVFQFFEVFELSEEAVELVVDVLTEDLSLSFPLGCEVCRHGFREEGENQRERIEGEKMGTGTYHNLKSKSQTVPSGLKEGKAAKMIELIKIKGAGRIGQMIKINAMINMDEMIEIDETIEIRMIDETAQSARIETGMTEETEKGMIGEKEIEKEIGRERRIEKGNIEGTIEIEIGETVEITKGRREEIGIEIATVIVEIGR